MEISSMFFLHIFFLPVVEWVCLNQNDFWNILVYSLYDIDN